MKDIINGIIEFFGNTTLRLSHKAVFVLIVLVLIYVIDNYLDLSYNYKVSKKIEMLDRINAVIDNPKSDSVTLIYAISVRDELLQHTTWTDHLFAFHAKLDHRIANTNIPLVITKSFELTKN